MNVYNDMFDQMDGVMQAVAKKKSQWKEDLYFAMNYARHKFSKYCAEVTPAMGMLLITAHLLHPLQKLQSFRKWNKAIEINWEDETSYATPLLVVFLKYVENK